MAELTAVERVMVAHACEDWAGNWYGPQGGFVWSRSDCERYVAEGYLGKLCDRHGLAAVWAAVHDHLDAHPEILASGRLTDAQRVERQAARDRRAQELLAEAKASFHEGRWDDALALVNRAELESPTAVNFERYRQIVRKHAGVGGLHGAHR